ncbi:MAG: hypothetical protein KME64_30095 [Scytonematopsis contorta HA4267-MV1]|jgi:23S rRNA maturation mini-RNase III|nr:hypothetical protein [Scytonematopsis contorta HA4267-MV1]
MNLIVADTRQIAQLELDEYLWQQSQEIAKRARIRHSKRSRLSADVSRVVWN